MTSDTTRDAYERVITGQVAQQLVGEGYEVFVEPGPYLLPRELAGHRPDILARRGDENLVVEVKLIPDPAGVEQVRQLSQAVQSLPDWQFKLVTAVRPEPTTPWSVADAGARVGEAERLAALGHKEVAQVLLVAAAEAFGRQLAQAERVRVQPWSPVTLFRELIHHGLIDRADAELLERAVTARNRLIHGIADATAEPVEIEALIEAVRRLAGEAQAAARLAAASTISLQPT